MKLEIEITEEEIRSAIERKVRTAIADQSNQYGVDSYIKEQVRLHWRNSVNSLVHEMLNDSAIIRSKITAELERKLRKQLSEAIKIAEKGAP